MLMLNQIFFLNQHNCLSNVILCDAVMWGSTVMLFFVNIQRVFIFTKSINCLNMKISQCDLYLFNWLLIHLWLQTETNISCKHFLKLLQKFTHQCPLPGKFEFKVSEKTINWFDHLEITTFSQFSETALSVQLKDPLRRMVESTMANLWCIKPSLWLATMHTPASFIRFTCRFRQFHKSF